MEKGKLAHDVGETIHIYPFGITLSNSTTMPRIFKLFLHRIYKGNDIKLSLSLGGYLNFSGLCKGTLRNKSLIITFKGVWPRKKSF